VIAGTAVRSAGSELSALADDTLPEVTPGSSALHNSNAVAACLKLLKEKGFTASG